MRAFVISPTYKRPRTLLQAFRSLQEQTLSDIAVPIIRTGVWDKGAYEFNWTLIDLLIKDIKHSAEETKQVT